MEQIDVKILGREYRLAVSGDTKDQLLEAVRIVDEKMTAIRDSGRVSGVDRIAVMAALQLAHEMLGASGAAGAAKQTAMLGRVRKLREDVDAVLERQDSLF